MPTSQQEWLEYLGKAQPTYATLPTPDAPNELAKNELVAKALKTPLMPWQRYVIRVATEKNENGTYKYPVVVLTVPRQSGKTTLVRTVLTARAMLNKGRKAFYTAQTGKDAVARWTDLCEAVVDSVFGSKFLWRKSIGSQGLRFKDTKSSIMPFSPTAESLHGYTPHDVVIDEIFSFDDAQGTDLMGAILPAQQTIKDRQLWLISTAGHAGSAFLNGWVKAGREATEDPDAKVAYFEWSLPDGADPYDEANWGFHPAVGHTIENDALRDAAKAMSKGEFVRAFMNRYTPTVESVLDVEKWDTLKTELLPPDFSNVAIAYEVAPDRSRSSVVAAWKVNERVCIKVLKSAPSSDWVPAYIANLALKKPLTIGADDGGTVRATTDEIRRAHSGDEELIETLNGKDFGTASVAFKQRLEDSRLSHDGDDLLRVAIATAVTRKYGETWAFSHTSQPELVASVVATRLLDYVEPKAPKPRIFFSE